MMATKSGASAAAIAKFKQKFEKSYGEDVMKTAAYPQYEVISTGSVLLDKAMGCGGFVEGRITEMWGPPSGGKSTIAMIACGNAQKKHPEKLVGWIDVEHTFDGSWAEKLGMSLEQTQVVDPRTAEDVADIMKDMLESGVFSMVVLDSVGAMLPEDEYEKDAGEATMGTAAKIITRMVKKGAYYARANSVAVIIINQQRANLGYGADTTTGGGFALKHVTTHKLNVKRSGTTPFTIGTKPNDVQVGFELAVRVEKNKVAPPMRQAVFSFFNQASTKYGPMGIDRAQEAFSLALVDNIIKQGGAFYTLPDERKFQGKDKVIEVLREEPQLIEEIRAIALEAIKHEIISDEATEVPA